MKTSNHLEKASLALRTLVLFLSSCDPNDISSPEPENPDKPEWLLKKKSVLGSDEYVTTHTEYTYNSFYKPSLLTNTDYEYEEVYRVDVDTLIYNDQQQLIQVGNLDTTTRNIETSIFIEYNAEGKLVRIWNDELGEEYDVRYSYTDTSVIAIELKPSRDGSTTDTTQLIYTYDEEGNLSKYVRLWANGAKSIHEYLEYDQNPVPHSLTNLTFGIPDIYSAPAPFFSVNSWLLDRLTHFNAGAVDTSYIGFITKEYEYNEDGLVTHELGVDDGGYIWETDFEYVRPKELD